MREPAKTNSNQVPTPGRRAAWVRPRIRKLATAQARAGSGGGPDYASETS